MGPGTARTRFFLSSVCNTGLLVVAIAVCSACLPGVESGRGVAGGKWLTQEQVDERVKVANFRVSAVLYASRSGRDGSDVLDAYQEAAQALNDFDVKGYKVDCDKNPSVRQCKENFGELPCVYVYHGTSHTQLTRDQATSGTVVVASTLQIMLNKFRMGSGKLLQVLSTLDELVTMKRNHNDIAVFATKDYLGKGHRSFLEAAYYFLNSRHGYKLTLAVTKNMKLYESEALVSTHATEVLWATHARGGGYMDVVNSFHGEIEPQRLTSFFFGSSLSITVSNEEITQDGKLMEELNVHNDFGLTLAFLACRKPQLSKGLELAFSGVNERFHGNIAGILVNVRDKQSVSQIPEVQALVEESKKDESLRQPLVILRPGAQGGERPDPVAVFNLSIDNLELAYRSILPALPQSQPLKTSKKPSTTTQKPAKAEAQKDLPPPQTTTKSSKTERTRYKEQHVNHLDSDEFDSDEFGDDFTGWKGDENTTQYVGNNDDVSHMSERMNRLEQLLRIRPSAHLRFMRRSEMPELPKLAPAVVVLFYTPYSSSARLFRIVMSNIAKEFEDRKADIAFRAVNCGQLPDVCREIGVKRMPSVQFLARQPAQKKPVYTRYKDYLDYGTLLKTIHLLLRPPVSKCSTRQQLIDLISKHYGSTSEVVAVALLGPNHLPEYSTFRGVAARWKGRVQFVGATGTLLNDLLAKHNMQVPSILLIKPRDLAEPYKQLKGKIVDGKLKKFLKSSIEPIMGPLTPENTGRLMDEGRSLVAYIGRLDVPANEPSGDSAKGKRPYWQKLLAAVKAAAMELEFETHYKFVWLPMNAPFLDEIRRSLNMASTDATAAIIDRRSESVFAFSGTPTKKSVSGFLRKHANGETYPSGHFMKSEWPPSGSRGTDFLSRAKNLPFWAATGQASKGGETISEATTHGRIKAMSQDDDDELKDGDEIEDRADIDGNYARSQQTPSGKTRKHSEL